MTSSSVLLVAGQDAGLLERGDGRVGERVRDAQDVARIHLLRRAAPDHVPLARDRPRLGLEARDLVDPDTRGLVEAAPRAPSGPPTRDGGRPVPSPLFHPDGGCGDDSVLAATLAVRGDRSAVDQPPVTRPYEGLGPDPVRP